MIKDLLIPEDHSDPYIWSAVLLAHGFIGQMLTLAAMLIIEPISAFLVVSLLYLLVWEIPQFYRQPTRRIAIDSLLDWLGVSCGSISIVCVERDELLLAICSMSIVLVLAVIGYQRRT